MNTTLTEDIDHLDGVTTLLTTLCSITGMQMAGIAQQQVVRRVHAVADSDVKVGSSLPSEVAVSVPILLNDGTHVATLFGVGMDTPHAKAIFELGATQIALQLDALRSAHTLHQFMHDLRNPVGAISNGATLMGRLPLDERGKNIAEMMRDCTVKMVEMLEALRKKV